MRTAQPGMARNVDEYIAGFPIDVQQRLEKIRAVIREAAPEAEETIKYRMPTFVMGENLVHFAAFSKHIGFYPTPSGIVKFEAELSKFKSAKGSVQFPLDEPIPLGLIRKIVHARVEEVHSKSHPKRKK